MVRDFAEPPDTYREIEGKYKTKYMYTIKKILGIYRIQGLLGKLGDQLSRRWGRYVRWDTVIRVMVAYQVERGKSSVAIPRSILETASLREDSYLYGLKVECID